MKTPEELFAALGNRGEYAALPHVTLDEVKMIYAEGHAANCETFEYMWEKMNRELRMDRAVIHKLRLAINEAIAISGTGTPQDWTSAQVVLCKALAEVKVMLGEKS